MNRRMQAIAWGLCWVVLLLLWSHPVRAGQLSDRLSQFPDWQSKPAIGAARGDLAYPDWMAGTWNVTSTLVDTIAPLAPDIVTPGYEGNHRYLRRPVSFLVRFVPAQQRSRSWLETSMQTVVVADRGFNGKQIAKAYLGENNVVSVRVDEKDPNYQVTQLKGEKQFVSIVTRRATEQPDSDRFIATEVYNQIFRSPARLYLNEVETTTEYERTAPETIAARQVTAVYLSPKDPDYFKANGRPVSLYRYQLNMEKL